MFGPIKNVVFDFDGTLVNTMPSVIRGLGEAVKLLTGKNPTTEELVMSFGPAPREVLEKWMPAEKIPDAYKFWLEFEKTLGPEEMVAFPEVDELLQKLQALNYNLGIFTGRDRPGTLKIMHARGWLKKYFTEQDMVCGDDGHKVKPEPDALVHLLKTHNWNAVDTLMVGDHAYDMIAGRAAGTKTAAVLWDLPPGKTPRVRFKAGWEKWDKVDCDLRLPSPLSLMQWLKGV